MRHALRRAGTALLVLVTLVTSAAGVCAATSSADEQDVSVKAAFLVNFAKFTTWPAIKADAPVAICVVGDDALFTVLVDTARGQSAGDHPIEVRRAADRSTWPACQILFVGAGEVRRASEVVTAVRTAPILTVSDAGGFAQAGIIELYVQERKVRFAINVDAVGRSGLHLSSRLLALARIVRDDRAQ